MIEDNPKPNGSAPSPDKTTEQLNISRNTLELLKLELLKKVDLFQSFSEDAVEEMSESFQEILLKTDEVLFEEGAPERNMYIILSGELLIYKLKKQIAVLGPGQYIGEMSLIESKPRSASARALSDVLLLEIGEEQFNRCFLSEPQALVTLMRTLSGRLRNDIDIMGKEMQTLNNFTHDIRNCLVPLGIPEILLTQVMDSFKGTQEGHKEREGWEKVKKSSDILNAVKNNVLVLVDQSLACARKIKSEYVKDWAPIGELVQETMEEIRCHKFLHDKNLKVIVNSDPGKAMINSLDIKRVLQNLIINAGYVSEKQGQIEAIVNHLGDKVQVSVKDYGTGIPDDVKPRILMESITTKPDGNGFGLMSCRDIIQDYHQGKLWFESEFGKGTTFHFTLPIDS